MKANNSSPGKRNVKGANRFIEKGRPVSALQKRDLAVQWLNIKNGLVREFGTTIGGHSQLLRSALAEAEALAWQTPYPHLLFPVLAEEKAVAVNHWAARQRRVQRVTREMSLAE